MNSPVYAPLWCKSYFSFLEGASSPEELVLAARQQGLPALALTDRDGVHGVPSAYITLRDAEGDASGTAAGTATPVPCLIVGSEVTVDDGSTLVLLAADRTGYRHLCRLVTRGRLRCAKGSSRVSWLEVGEHAGGLLALWGGEQARLGEDGAGWRPPASVRPDAPPPAAPLPLAGVAGILRDTFGDRLYALAARHRQAGEPRSEQRLRRRAAGYGLPVVAGIEVLYHHPRRRRLQDVLTCLRHGTTLAAAGDRLRPNDGHALPSPAAFARLFADDPAAVARTLEVAERCAFSLAELRYRYPSERLPAWMTMAQWLEKLTLDGARRRFGDPVPGPLAARIRSELGLIHDLDYDGYFLTMWEIVQFCEREGILCQGRGSAANSVVCYCLGVTAVNPREVDLLFERFISRERAEPPDIDLDIEHDRREEVIQHVYRKYGRDRAAMVANVVRFRPRSAVREVGKALGLPAVQLDRLARLTSHRGAVTEENLRAAGLDPAAPAHAHLLDLVDEIQDFPRHLSIHPGGFLLGHEPVCDLVPVENATMADRTVIQWDKHDVEALGLFKVDLLGLGSLNHLHRAFDLLRDHRGRELSLAALPREDAATFAMLSRADTVGVFQVESRAQMAMLPRLAPRSYYDLVIQVAIIRPGPITGGMVHPFIARRHGKEPVIYPHPSLEPVLRKTLGVPLFQEQVMRLAMEAADYTPGEADQLRRDMAQWRRHGPIERHHERLVSRMVTKGIAPDFAERVFDQIRGFGEYGFPESHAASFALIAYATAWVKCHYPAEFACALLNAWPMGFYLPGTIVEDARRHGVEVRPIDVGRSAWECTLEETTDGLLPGGAASAPPGDSAAAGGGGADPAPPDDGAAAAVAERPLALRMGLRFVKGLARRDGERLTAVRDEGAFTSIADLARRTRLPVDALLGVAEAGAFSSLEPDRRHALWQVHGLARTGRPEQLELPLADRAPAPRLRELSELETITWDWNRSQHSPRGHLLEPLRGELEARGWPTAAAVNRMRDRRRVDYAGIVICRQQPATAKNVTFMTLEDETGFVNLVLWGNVYREYRVLAKTLSFLGVSGRIQNEEGLVHLIVEKLWKPRLPRQPATAHSRDFR
ncbi:MAG: error-prone DNA polymerase [Candidatus Krumholzibacteriia bacterium]